MILIFFFSSFFKKINRYDKKSTDRVRSCAVQYSTVLAGAPHKPHRTGEQGFPLLEIETLVWYDISDGFILATCDAYPWPPYRTQFKTGG